MFLLKIYTKCIIIIYFHFQGNLKAAVQPATLSKRDSGTGVFL